MAIIAFEYLAGQHIFQFAPGNVFVTIGHIAEAFVAFRAFEWLDAQVPKDVCLVLVLGNGE